MLWVAPALADEAKLEPKAGEEGVEHEGGKFSLLGRECKAEEAGLETTPGSPPLDVDDPATPGCNAWEINIVTSGELGKTKSWTLPLFDINYGVGDNLQIKYEIPYEVSTVDGVSHAGFGRAEVGLKYRFYDDESRELTVAVYPQLEFAIPGTAAAEGDDGVGTLTKLPVLYSMRVAETARGPIMITANAAYNRSTEPATESYISAAFGVGFPLTSKIATMVETSTEQAVARNMENVREHSIKANVGFIGGINHHLLWFASLGRSFASSDADDPNQNSLVLGIRVLAGGP